MMVVVNSYRLNFTKLGLGKLAVGAFGLLALTGTSTTDATHKRATQSSVVPFAIVSSGGNPRPIVAARINGHPMQMMVHSNAGFFAQLRHDQSTTFGITFRNGHKSYGIDRAGHVSKLGLDRGVAARLAVGSSINRDAEVAVFEVPQSKYGMLGVAWIRANRIILNYVRKQALVSPGAARVASNASALLRSGYVALPMTYDVESKRYLVRATINGISRSMVIASASEFTIDSEFARVAKIPSGADTGYGSGPTGTQVTDATLGVPVRIRIDEWTSPPIADGSVEDTYGYTDEKRPSTPSAARGGYLGGAFFLKTGAVIDFGSCLLYVRRN